MDGRYTVAVRALCEFTAKQGDLDFRHTPSASASEGLAGQRTLAARRGPQYVRELSLQGRHEDLTVRGRADGFDTALCRLEEFKTYRGDLERMPGNRRSLHWAQLKIYGAMVCHDKGLEAIQLALVYLNADTEVETVFVERHLASALKEYFEQQGSRFLAWAKLEDAHRRGRNAALHVLKFPYQAMHQTQRVLARAVFRTVRDDGALMAQAPTGAGKTAATLFPALKAAAVQDLDKILYLTAKGAGRRAAMDTLNGMLGSAVHLRVLEFVSKATLCVYPQRSCHGASCPLARGFFDRLPDARRAAADQGMLGRGALVTIAAAAEVCPYYLMQEMARWADVIVADYNYYFDTKAVLHALCLENEWRIALLVDEAHNLLPRARDMYSASLSPERFEVAHAAAPASLKRIFRDLGDAWEATGRASGGTYTVLAEAPSALMLQVGNAVTALSDALAEQLLPLDDALMQAFFELLQFKRLAEAIDENSLIDCTFEGDSPALPRLCVRNVVPARFLAARFAASTSTVLFSATFAPEAYYRRLLGLPARALRLEIQSEFSAHQLRVRIAPQISTRYAHRAGSVASIVASIEHQYHDSPGNYLAFFSSFEYLAQVCDAFEDRCPDISCWRQTRAMSAHDRERYVARFVPHGRGIGFAVLGGLFAEGIDLPGTRLIGAFIATLGMPQINAVNAQVQLRMEALFGDGFEYTYLYPGIEKVVQAAGRVIRSVSDRGTVWLMDDRYLRVDVRQLLPAWWHVEVNSPAAGAIDCAGAISRAG